MGVEAVMSYRRRAGGGRRDGNEQAIVQALRQMGATVWFIGGTGNPDLLVLFRGFFTPLETKRPKGTLTKNQQDIPWPVVRTPEEAMQAVNR